MSGEASTVPSILEEDGELDIPVLPSTYFECQKGIGEGVDRAETFSPSYKYRFQQWAKGTEICLAEAQLQQESYRTVPARIQEAEKCKNNSRRVIQKGGAITVEGARLRMKEKEEKLKADAIKKAHKNIQVAMNTAKAALNRHGIDARKAEKERKQQMQMIQTQGGIVPAELTIPIHDPEKNPSPEDLESLLAPDLLQALLILEPTSITGAGAGMGNSQSEDTMDDAGEVQIYTNNQQVRSGDGFTRDTGI